MEQRVDVGPVACIGDERCCAGFGGNGIKGLATARRDRDAHSALAREGARETRTEAGPAPTINARRFGVIVIRQPEK